MQVISIYSQKCVCVCVCVKIILKYIVYDLYIYKFLIVLRTNKFYLHDDTSIFMIYLYIFVENIYKKYICSLY